MRILVTGSAGYIGSHFSLAAILAGHELILVDNYLSGSPLITQKLQALSHKTVPFCEVDCRREKEVLSVFEAYSPIDVVVHFAALKSTSDSLRVPAEYYENNCAATINLVEAMLAYQCDHLIFSSTAAVYAKDASMPCAENALINPETPYGKSKWMTEQILSDICASNEHFSAVSFRYFNAVSADRLGRVPFMFKDTNNSDLFSEIVRVLTGRKSTLNVFGDDYPTADGTALRDYVHVQDLVDAHLLALNLFKQPPDYHCINLGRGQGVSVLEVVAAFEQATQQKIPLCFDGVRAGDLPVVFADCDKAVEVLGFRAKRNLQVMVSDLWANIVRYQGTHG